jgi:hypothetical protein
MMRRSMPCEYITYIRQCVGLTFVGNRYEKVDGSTRAGLGVSLPTNWTVEVVESWLMVHAVAVNAGKAVHPDTDLFAQDFDMWVECESRFALCLFCFPSLSATFLKNRIIGSLLSSSDRQVQESASRIEQNTIFSSPSIRQLARSVINAVLMPLVPFSEWPEQLESSAEDTSEENFKRIVRVFQWLNGTFSYLVFRCSLLSSLSTLFVT